MIVDEVPELLINSEFFSFLSDNNISPINNCSLLFFLSELSKLLMPLFWSSNELIDLSSSYKRSKRVALFCNEE